MQKLSFRCIFKLLLLLFQKGEMFTFLNSCLCRLIILYFQLFIVDHLRIVMVTQCPKLTLLLGLQCIIVLPYSLKSFRLRVVFLCCFKCFIFLYLQYFHLCIEIGNEVLLFVECVGCFYFSLRLALSCGHKIGLRGLLMFMLMREFTLRHL